MAPRQSLPNPFTNIPRPAIFTAEAKEQFREVCEEFGTELRTPNSWELIFNRFEERLIAGVKAKRREIERGDPNVA